MKARQKKHFKRLRLAQFVSLGVALLVAMLIISDNRHQRSAASEQLRGQNRLKMLAAKDHIEDFIEEIELCLRLMSRYPQVLGTSDEADAYLDAIYQANHDQHQLSEVYIIRRDFAGTARPFKAFEDGDEAYEAEQHSLKREEEEYAIQMDHIRRFSADESLQLLISKPLDLCVGERGRVLSVPIWADGEILGIVAGMVTSDVVSQELEESSPKTNAVLLTSEDGNAVGCTDFPPPMYPWFQERFDQEGVSGFFGSQGRSFQAGQYAAMWTEADFPDGGQWRVTFLYDEQASLAAIGVSSQAAGWGTAAMVLLLGSSVVILCRVLAAFLVTREEAEKQALELRDKEGRLRSILDGAADGIIICDDRGIIESFNTSAERIFGWTEDDMLGRNVRDLASSPYAENHDAYISRYIETGDAKIIGRGREVIGKRKNGKTFPMVLAVSELRLGGRRLFTGIIRDVTEWKEAEDIIRRHSDILEQTVKERTLELATAKEKAEASNRAKSHFLANMSHELRTPLHAILSFAGFGIKERGASSPEELVSFFESIQTSGRTLMALLNDILDLSKLESAGETLDRKPVDLAELIQSVSLEFTLMAHEKDLVIGLASLDQPITVEVDAAQAKQVVRNLLSNAVKFSPKGAAIQLAARVDEGRVRLFVRDEGPGIPEGELETVFDKFVQSSRTNTGAGGTGLGLAICRQIANAHNGRIWAQNNSGGGALFTFELPLRATSRRLADRSGVKTEVDAHDG